MPNAGIVALIVAPLSALAGVMLTHRLTKRRERGNSKQQLDYETVILLEAMDKLIEERGEHFQDHPKRRVYEPELVELHERARSFELKLEELTKLRVKATLLNKNKGKLVRALREMENSGFILLQLFEYETRVAIEVQTTEIYWTTDEQFRLAAKTFFRAKRTVDNKVMRSGTKPDLLLRLKAKWWNAQDRRNYRKLEKRWHLPDTDDE